MLYYHLLYEKQGKIYEDTVSKRDLEKIESTYKVLSKKRVLSWRKSKGFMNYKQGELLTFFQEIDMILQSGISLYDTLKIVEKRGQKQYLQSLLNLMIKYLENGTPLYKAFLEYERNIDPIIISFFKLCHMKGDMTMTFHSLCQVLELKKRNQELLMEKLSYPLILLITFIIALVVIFTFVLPKFETIFFQYSLDLPIYTILLLGVKNIIVDYGYIILLFIFFIYSILKRVLNTRTFRVYWHKILMNHLPLISGVLKNYQLYNFFILVNILMKSHYELDVALKNSRLLLKNQYLLDKIVEIERCINNGLAVCDSFEAVDVFDDIVISIINSGENSANMIEALQRIERYYENYFTKSIKRLSSFIEPIFFLVMMLLILWIMLAIFTPVWNMSSLL